jgi:hypothetical protein
MLSSEYGKAEKTELDLKKTAGGSGVCSPSLIKGLSSNADASLSGASEKMTKNGQWVSDCRPTSSVR